MRASALKELESVAASERPWLSTVAYCDEKNLVDRERFEASLEKVRARVKNPALGLFGPDSMVWRLYGSEASSIGVLRMLLLQNAHPFVAHAVQQKSAYRTDTPGRTERTLRAVINWVYGDLERVFASARTVFQVHSHIHGTIANRVGPYDAGDAYAATEQRAQFWVHATGVYNAWSMYEHVYGPLSREERERFNEETKLLALIFGIDEALLPPTFDDFLEYWDKMLASDVITPDQASRDIARYLLASPFQEASRAFSWLRIMSAGLLPSRIRHGYELPWGSFEQRVFEASMKAVRAIFPRLPHEMRHTFYHRRAMHRALHSTPSALERRLNQAFIQAMQSVPAKLEKQRQKSEPARRSAA